MLDPKQLPSFASDGPLKDPSWSRTSEARVPWLTYARDHLVVLEDGVTLAIRDESTCATLFDPYQHTPVARICGPHFIPGIQNRGHTGLAETEIERFGRQARRVARAGVAEGRPLPRPVDVLKFSPDGRTLAFHVAGVQLGGLGVGLIDVASGRTLLTNAPARWRVVDLVFTPDGHSLVMGGFSSQIHIWRLRPNAFEGHQKETWSLAFSPDGRTLASASDDGTIKLWEMADGRERATLHGHDSLVTTVAYSPDGTLLASAGFDRTIRLWNAATGDPVATLRGHIGRVCSLAFTPDGKTLATAGDDREIRIWDVAHQSESSPPLTGHAERVCALVFAKDGKTLFSAARDKTIRLWDWLAGEARAVWPAAADIHALAVAPDGQTLAAGYSGGTAALRDPRSGKSRATLRHAGDVLGLAFSPDGLSLATTSRDKTVRVWDPATGQELLTLKGHAAPVHAAAFSPDGTTLATGSQDGAIKLCAHRVKKWTERSSRPSLSNRLPAATLKHHGRRRNGTARPVSSRFDL